VQRGQRAAAEDVDHGGRGEGREEDAVAVVARRDDDVVEPAPTDARRVVRRAGAQSGRRLQQLELVDPGHDGARVAEQLVHGARLHRGVDPALFDRRAHDEGAVAPGDQVHRVPAHQAADGAAEQRAGAARRRAEAQDVSLHWSNLRPRVGVESRDVRQPDAGR
jgi:hypothetical protein